MRKIRTAVICLVLITILATSCYASQPIGVGGGDPVSYSGDIEAEKSREAFFTGIPLLIAASTSTADSGMGLKVEDDDTNEILKWFYNSELAYWQIYPMGRWSLTLVDPDNPGMLDFIGKAKNAIKNGAAFIASGIMILSIFLVKIAISLTVFVFNTELLGIFAAWIGVGIGNVFGEGSDIMYLLLALVCISLIIYSTKKLLEGAAMSVLKAVLIAICSVGLTMLLVANAGEVFEKIADTTDVVTGMVLAAIGSHTHKGISMKDDEVLPDDPLNRGLLIFGQTTWNTVIASPWGASLFGTIDTNELRLTEDEARALEPYDDHFNKNKLPEAGDRVDLVYLGTTGDARYHFVEVLVRPDPEIDRGAKGTMVGLSLDSVLSHLLISILILCAAFALIVLVLRTGIPILFGQVMLVCLALISPMIAMMMAVPARGLAIAKSYLKIFLHYLLVKVIYGIYLSIVIAIATVVCLALLENGQIGFSLIFLIAMFVGATIFAGTFKDLFFRILDSSDGSGASQKIDSWTSQKSKSALKTPPSLGYKAGKTTIKKSLPWGYRQAKKPVSWSYRQAKKPVSWSYKYAKKKLNLGKTEKEESGRKDTDKKGVKEKSGRKDNEQNHKRAKKVAWLSSGKTRKEKSGTKGYKRIKKTEEEKPETKDTDKEDVKEKSGRKDNEQNHKRAKKVTWLNSGKTRKEKSETKDQEGVDKE